jgi:hypothetical protein
MPVSCFPFDAPSAMPGLGWSGMPAMQKCALATD